MIAKTFFDARLAVLLAAFVVAGSPILTGCVADETTVADDKVTPDVANSGLSIGAKGAEVHEVYQYLRRYGYFQNEELAAHYPNWAPAVNREPVEPDLFDDALEEGVRLFQRANGLRETGIVNDEMRNLMKQIRCEMPDYYTPPNLHQHTQIKNFTTGGSTWSSTALSYRFVNYTSDISQSSQRTAIQNAMLAWTAVSPITFTEVTSGGNILMGFYTGDHGSCDDFDGSGGVLAHAWYPSGGGDIHFDDAESWSTGSSGTHLQTVAMHELGHSLGLGHSTVSSATMYAYYTGSDTSLSYDDHAGIWSLYGTYSSPSGCGTLEAGEGLGMGEYIMSCDGRFKLAMQTDGNLVLYMGTKSLWDTNTHENGGNRVVMQEDGNLVVYKSNGNDAWDANTNSTANQYAHLAIQNDGNLVIYKTNGGVAWASGTCCH